MHRRAIRLGSFTILLSFLFLISISGAYATWRYAGLPPVPVDTELSVILSQWTGSEILPDDDAIGENHRLLVENIVNGDSIGLNTSNSYLNKQIAKRQDDYNRDTLGSMAVTQGSELERLFGTEGEAENLTFLIHFVSDTEYEIFTTGVYLGERGEVGYSWFTPYTKTPGDPTVPIGDYVYPVYKTTVVKTNGTWTAADTKLGAAKSAWYDENQNDRYKNVTQIPSFNPDSWTEDVTLGTNVTNAIWTYEGQHVTARCGNTSTVLYYQIKPDASGTLTVSSSTIGARFSLLNAGGGTILSGNGSVSYPVTADTKYYIAVRGAASIAFTITLN